MFSVFPESENIFLGISFSVPKFGKEKFSFPDPFLKTGTRKLWCLVDTIDQLGSANQCFLSCEVDADGNVCL
jgi:hypothetical protein